MCNKVLTLSDFIPSSFLKNGTRKNMLLNLKDLHYVYSSHCFITLTKVGEVVN